MKMDCKRFIGLLGIFLAFGLVFVACNDGNTDSKGNGNVNGNDDGNDKNVPDPTVTPIEAAFTNMLQANFTSGSDVTVSAITKMSNWGQTNSEYAVNGTNFGYKLPSSFGTVQVMSDGAAVFISEGGAVLMTGPDASIEWGTPTGDTSIISGKSSSWFYIVSGSDAITVAYPYTVSYSYPSGSDAQIIKGKLNLNRLKWSE